MRWALLVACACGRIAFDPRGDAGPTADAYTGCPVIAAAPGRGHTCAVDMRGNVWCFGKNEKGQVQPGGPDPVVAPTQIPLPMAATDVSAGRGFSCAILADKSVQCWGDDSNGQLGNGLGTGNGPTQAELGGESAIAIASGAGTTCIIRESDRSVMCWGDGIYYTLARTTENDALQPLLIAGTAGTQRISLGHRHVCMIDGGGSTKCWGRNHVNQITAAAGAPQQMPFTLPLGAAVDVGTGGVNTCVALADGRVACAGVNYYAQLGQGDFVGRSDFALTPVTGAQRVATNSFGSCAVLADGNVVCWGGARPGDADVVTDPPSPAPLANVTDLLFGFYHSCALAGGALNCWGPSGNGELGRGESWTVMSPRDVLSSVSSFSLGHLHSCAVVGGQLQCWGANDYGQLGDGTILNSYAPKQIATGLPTVDGVTAGFEHTCAWGGGALACWGRDHDGRLALPGTVSGRHPTASIVPGVTNVVQAGVGSQFSCALTGTQVMCWGDNGSGQLGDNTMTSRATPQLVSGITNATQLVVGGSFACVIDGGQMKCWGQNGAGQIGNNTRTNQLTPFTVPLPAAPARISVGMFSACAALTSGALYCWGSNTLGTLGLGDLMERLVPTQVIASGIADVTLAYLGGCARTTTNAIYCWGEGMLLDTAPGNRSLTPVLLPITSALIQRVEFATCTLDGGQLKCWGSPQHAADVDAIMRFGVPAPAAIPACP